MIFTAHNLLLKPFQIFFPLFDESLDFLVLIFGFDCRELQRYRVFCNKIYDAVI